MREQEEEVLRVLVRKWGPLLTFVFDRGYASGPWLEVLQKYGVSFIIRWIKPHLFSDAEGKQKHLWQIGLGKQYRTHKLIRDMHSGLQVSCDLWWGEVRHPTYRGSLSVVRARMAGKLCYLITNERISSEEQAWAIFFSYKRRWQIEWSFRYAKCELAMESPRLWSMENRLKLLGIVLLVYAFLLFLLEEGYQEVVGRLLRRACHRTGAHSRQARVPLYRLRWALSHLWQTCRPLLGTVLPPDLLTLQVVAAFSR